MSRRVKTIAIAGLIAWSGQVCAQTAPAPAVSAPAAAALAAPASVPLPTPSMSGLLALSTVPPSANLGPLGTWYVDGAFSGLGLVQSAAAQGDRTAIGDLGNAQLFVQKIDGLIRFYVQVGAYALPALGGMYAHTATAGTTDGKLFGPVPQAYIKLAPSDNFSIVAGKLPTLIGNGYTFTFENIDIERGLLWSQEPAVSRGVQANYIAGPVAFSLSVNDGFYASRYSWLSGSATWTIDPANVVAFAAGANLGRTSKADLATPLNQNNSAIYNLIYTYTNGPWVVNPYVQYSHVAADAAVRIARPASLYGAAFMVAYVLNPAFSIGARAEYEHPLPRAVPAHMPPPHHPGPSVPH
jgi:hypothetical protein